MLVLVLLFPLALLLLLVAMARVEERLLPAASTADQVDRAVGRPVARQPDDDLASQLLTPAQPGVHGAVTVPASAQ